MIRGIYNIIDTKNKKVYIGESIDINDRKRAHLEGLAAKVHPNKKLQQHYNDKDFKFNIEIELNESIKLDTKELKMLLLMLENKVINKYKELDYEILNIEESLFKVLNGDKNLFPGKDMSHDEVMKIYKKVNNKLNNELNYLLDLMSGKCSMLKDLYTMNELVRSGVLEEYIVGYKLNNKVAEHIRCGYSYETYVIDNNQEAKTIIEDIFRRASYLQAIDRV